MTALRHDDARVEPGAEGAAVTIVADIIAHVLADVKARTQTGETVSATDYPPEQRPAFWGAIAVLCDELPIRAGWRTIGEWHTDGRRMRERVYRLRQSGHVDAVLVAWLCVAAVGLALVVRGVLV
jgi:hypothetical protein